MSSEVAEVSRRMDEIVAQAAAQGALDEQFTQLRELEVRGELGREAAERNRRASEKKGLSLPRFFEITRAKKKKKLSQDESNPDFVSEVAALYFSDSTEKLDRLSQTLSQVTDPIAQREAWAPAVDAAVHQFKGASASFGAAAVAAACVRVRAAVVAGDFAAVCELLQNEVRREFEALRVRMGEYQQLDQRRKALLQAGGGGG
jgi:histidine-containing phosphotransfer protein